MKRILSILLVAVPAAVVALLWTSAPSTAQPVPPPGLRAVQHGSAFTGSGTTAAPLNLTPQSCAGSGSAVAGWGSDGTPTCVATGTLDGTGSAGKLTYWTDADTLGYGTGSTSVQHQGSLSVTQDLSASGLLYVLGKLSDSTSTGTSGQVLTVNGSGYPRWTAPSTGDIEGITTTSPLSGGCTSGTCALTTSMSTARILGRTTASTGVVEQLTGTQATAMLDAFTSALQGLVPASGGGTSKYLRADATWQVPPDADHALVTSGAIPRGNGTTQVASLLSDDGSTVTNAGDTDLTAGATKVGAFGGGSSAVQTEATCGHDIPLGADTLFLICQGGGVYGITGGWDGRILFVHTTTAVATAHEATASTAVNRIQITGGIASVMLTSETRMLWYKGSASRWQMQLPVRVGQLLSETYVNATTSLSVGTTATVTGATTLNGDVTVGNASTDLMTVNATPTFNAGMSVNGLATFNDNLTQSDSGATVTLRGFLSALGSISLGDALTDQVEINATLEDHGASPTISSCGSSPSVTGGNTAFTVTAGTGTVTGCTATFATAYDVAPTCVVSQETTGVPIVHLGTVSTSAVTLECESTCNFSGSKVHVMCIGH